MPGSIWSVGELVTAAKINNLGCYLLWDSVDAGVTLPAASIATPSLNQSFGHLLVTYSGARSSFATTAETMGVRLNGNTAAAYYGQSLTGLGAAASATATVGVTWGAPLGLFAGSTAPANYGAFGLMLFPGYSSSAGIYMSGIGLFGVAWGLASGNTQVQAAFGWYGATGPITTLTFLSPNGGNIVAPSRFSVYGIPA